MTETARRKGCVRHLLQRGVRSFLLTLQPYVASSAADPTQDGCVLFHPSYTFYSFTHVKGGHSPPYSTDKRMRIGHGYDAHRLVEGRPLILGGVVVPHDKGLLGHSDADVLVHAIIDALIGGAGLGDIGRHFPPSDNTYKDISSILLLEKTAGLIGAAGYMVINIDSTVVCESPRLSPHIPSMVINISKALGMSVGSVNVKAKTEEGLGFTGVGAGIASHAVALLDAQVRP